MTEGDGIDINIYVNIHLREGAMEKHIEKQIK